MRNGETKHIKTNLLSIKQLIQHKSIFYFAQKSLLHFIYRPIKTIQFQNFIFSLISECKGKI